jgi:hypothetical protein
MGHTMALKHLTSKEGETVDLEVESQYFHWRSNSTFARPQSLVAHDDSLGEKRKSTIVNLDYTNPLDEETNLELGERNLRRSDYATSNAALKIQNTPMI